MKLSKWLSNIAQPAPSHTVLRRRYAVSPQRQAAEIRLNTTHLKAATELLETRCLLSAAHDIVGLTALRSDPVYAAMDGKLDSGQRIGVAVIDSGVLAIHHDLRNNFLYYVDAVTATESADVFDARDPNGHGTHVAGTVLGGFSQQLNDRIGVATEAGLVAIRGLPSPGDSAPRYDTVLYSLNWVLANHAQFNIKVVNMSLGSPSNFNSVPQADDYARAIDALERLGITVVVSSGNSFPLHNGLGVSHPAVFATLSVGNTIPQNINEVIGGAQAGDPIIGVDFSPGADTFNIGSQRSTLENQVAAPGTSIVSSWNNGTYETLAGTSMASPMVAGMVALMQDAAITFGGRYLRPEEVAQIVRATADTFVDAPDPQTFRIPLDDNGQLIVPRLPNGQVDISRLEDLRETGQTFRRVNIQRAVQAVRTLVMRDSGGGGGGGGGGGQQSGDTDNTFTTAIVVPPLNGTATFNFQGQVGRDGQVQVGNNDVDLLKLTLETPGALDILLRPVAGGQSFDPYLRVFDANGNAIAFDDDSNGPYPALQTGALPAGTYYVGISSFDNDSYNPSNGSGSQDGLSSGDYQLEATTINPDPNGVIQGAIAIDLTSPNYAWPADSQAVQAGIFVANVIRSEIGSDPHPLHDDAPDRFPERLNIGAKDVDMLRVVAPDNGRLFVDIESRTAHQGNAVDSFVAIWRLEDNGAITLIGSNDDFDDSLDSFLAVSVEFGKTYVIALTTAGNIGFNPVDPADRPSSTDTGVMDAYISFFNGDVNGTAYSNVSLNNTAFDPNGDGIGSFPGTIGVDFGQALLGANSGFKDVDFLRFTAQQSGPLRVTVTSPDSTLNAVLGIWQLNEQQTDIVEITDTAGTQPMTLLEVIAGQTLWISITGEGNSGFNWAAPGSGSGGDTGNFLLTTEFITENQFRGFSNNTVNLNTPTTLSVNQEISESIGNDANVVVGADDVDIFTFTPAATARYYIRTTTAQEGSADTFLRVFNQSGQEVGFNDNASLVTSASELYLDLVQGVTYYIGVNGTSSNARNYNPLTGAGAAAGSTGTYGLLVSEAPVGSSKLSVVSQNLSKLEGQSGNTTFVFAVTRTGDTTGTASATYAVTGSGSDASHSADSGDFGGTFPAGTVTFLAGETEKTISISVIGDIAVENNETFALTLSNPSQNAEIETPSANAVIQNDDSTAVDVRVDNKGMLTITDNAGLANSIVITTNAGTQKLVVTSTRSELFLDGFGAPRSTIEFPLATVSGLTAKLGNGDDQFDLSTTSLSSSLDGGAGNDTLKGGTQNDTLTGGTGADVLAAGGGTADVLSEATQTNLVLTSGQLSIGGAATQDVDALTGFERGLFFGGGTANVMDASAGGIPVTMFGGGGNDVLIGGNQADNIDGQGGNDTITGSAGNDKLFGGAGNDGIREVAYADVVAGQTRAITLTNAALSVKVGATTLSADLLTGFESADISGGPMRDIITLSGFTATGVTTVSGGGGNDVIAGTDGPDLIFTLTGADSISGGGGSDSIFSGNGNDTISGGAGADNLNGQNGNDSLTGDTDNDLLVGGAGSDTLAGNAGNDMLSGQTEPGLLIGGDGNDTLQGANANDTLQGDAGDDRLYGLQGDDVISGGDGLDLLLGAIGNDSLNGGAGADTLQGDVGNDTLNGGTDVDVDRINEVLDANFTIVGISLSSNGLGNDTVVGIERIQLNGGASNNLFDARQANVPVFLSGAAGNDTLLGGSKADGIAGGDGDDVLSGGAGGDVLDGGAGTDYVFEKADANFTVNGVTIVSTITGTDTPTGVERIVLIGGLGANKLDATMASVATVLIGGRGNDTLLGGSASDTLTGGNRNDATVSGGDGTDSLNGGAGNDVYENDVLDSKVDGTGDTSVNDVFTLLPSWVDAI